MGISALSEMQENVSQAFSQSVADIVVLSPTGTGKTLAYLLPLVESINLASDELQAMVIVPGRELALQSASVLASMGSGVRGYACYGGRMAMDEHREMRKVCPQIVFGTPGRLIDHLDKDNLSASAIRTLVHRLKEVRRHVLLSATEADVIPQFVNMKRVSVIDYRDAHENEASRVCVQQLFSPSKDKLETLYAYLCTTDGQSTIVFANHRDSVQRIGDFLTERGFVVSIFHGGFDQQLREAALYKFSNGSANVMVCTDLASRGLDIDNIANVVHYHLPETPEAYVHRTGRTARWNAEGNSVFLLGPTETLPTYVEEAATLTLPEHLSQPALPRMCTIYIGKGKKDKISKGDIMGFLCKKGNLQKEDIGKIDVKERYAYVAVTTDKVAKLLKTVKNEKIKGLKTLFQLIK